LSRNEEQFSLLGVARMAVKVFVLGLPGSGKSTVARCIEMLVRDNRCKWFTLLPRISDYDILYTMFQNDTSGKFRSKDHDGFDLLDFDILDVALEEVERRARDYISKSFKRNELILIEFAREDYNKALKQFTSEFLDDAYFIFINTDIPTCISRINERVAHPSTLDDHFVSTYIFDAYYQKDTKQYSASSLENISGVDTQRIMVIDNRDSLRELFEKVHRSVSSIYEQEKPNLLIDTNSLENQDQQKEQNKSLSIDNIRKELAIT